MEHLPSRVHKILLSTATSPTKPKEKTAQPSTFFLENGKIKINLSQENNSATGTANNDAYQEIRAQINGLNKQMMSIYESMSDTTLTDEQREAKGKEMENLENSMISAIKAGINKNITNRWVYSC